MSETLHGGCTCGAVRYRVAAGRQLPVYACHCTDCQARSGGAFALLQGVTKADIAVEGDTIELALRLPSGVEAGVIACADCETRLYSFNARRPAIATLRVGTLDNAADLVPALHFWVRSKRADTVIPEGVPAIETQPTTVAELNALFGEPR